MNVESKITQLRNLIEETLGRLIDNDYVYLDLPYHQNPGDILIWEGTEQFLSKLPYHCLYKASKDTYQPQNIAPNVIIILHGGGNFGDVWREHQQFRLSIIRQFPDNPIIVLPQTVHYDNAQILKEEASIMRNHRNLTICARDDISYRILKENNFSTKILLLPDMAFCISLPSIQKYRKQEMDKCLFVKRTDKELLCFDAYEKRIRHASSLVVQDWPSYEHPEDSVITELWRLKDQGEEQLYIQYVDEVLKPYLIQQAVEFVSQYRMIYTTRLHVAILCVLLHRPVAVFDNSYGKNKSFYDTWLLKTDGTKFVYRSFYERVCEWCRHLTSYSYKKR